MFISALLYAIWPSCTVVRRKGDELLLYLRNTTRFPLLLNSLVNLCATNVFIFIFQILRNRIGLFYRFIGYDGR